MKDHNKLFEEYYRNFFAGKKITKQGFGILGRGGGVTKFLIEMGADILVTDLKARENFTEQILELENFKKEIQNSSQIQYCFGGHRIEDFTECDFVIQASGVPKDNLYLQAARKKGIKVYQESSLFCEIIKNYFDNSSSERKKINILGITGTRGKTTTTFLLYEILKNNFANNLSETKVYLGGNVQGVATLEILKKIKAGDCVVMELDSWILQGFQDIKFSPQLSIFTNLLPDHMNYYQHNMQDYFLDKAQIFLFSARGGPASGGQNLENKLILSESSLAACKKYLASEIFEKLKYILVSAEEIEKDKKNYFSPLLGEHNRLLISLALAAAKSLNLNDEKITEAIRNFSGVPGRLEMRREIQGVKYFNDTTATTQEATLAALQALVDLIDKNKATEKIMPQIILICGGCDKQLSYSDLVQKIIDLTQKNILKKIILLFDNQTTTGSDRLMTEFIRNNFTEFLQAKNLSEAVNLATDHSRSGDIILFSPASASFGLFKNEYDRGDQFNKIVDGL